MMDVLLTTEQLAIRWHMAIRSLENWRNSDRPHPPFTKPSGARGRVLYRLDDIIDWEEKHMENIK